MVRVTAPVRLVRERLRRRDARKSGTAGHYFSEVGWEVYLKMRLTEERITRRHILVNTATDIKPAIDRIVKAATSL